MARFNNPVVFLAALVLAGSVAVSGVLGQVTETDMDTVFAQGGSGLALSPEDFKDKDDDDSGLSPALSPGFYRFAEQCAGKIDDECGEEIIGYLFTDEAVLTDTCCLELLGVGKTCHQAMVRVALSQPVFDPYEPEVLRRSEELWNKCVYVGFRRPQPGSAPTSL